MNMTCKQCGKEFAKRYRGHDSNLFCSRECAFTYQHEHIKVKENNVIHCVCVYCGKNFVSARKKKYCSEECRYEAFKANKRDNYISKRDTNDYVIKVCGWCGKEYQVNFNASKSEYCSARCLKAKERSEYKAKRKGQMQRAYIEPVYFKKIYKRDNGICQICGKPVVYDKSPSDIMAATIDHIIPLSKGGLHCRSNCQLAHRICNSIKGDKLAQAPPAP